MEAGRVFRLVCGRRRCCCLFLFPSGGRLGCRGPRRFWHGNCHNRATAALRLVCCRDATNTKTHTHTHSLAHQKRGPPRSWFARDRVRERKSVSKGAASRGNTTRPIGDRFPVDLLPFEPNPGLDLTQPAAREHIPIERVCVRVRERTRPRLVTATNRQQTLAHSRMFGWPKWLITWAPS